MQELLECSGFENLCIHNINMKLQTRSRRSRHSRHKSKGIKSRTRRIRRIGGNNGESMVRKYILEVNPPIKPLDGYNDNLDLKMWRTWEAFDRKGPTVRSEYIGKMGRMLDETYYLSNEKYGDVWKRIASLSEPRSGPYALLTLFLNIESEMKKQHLVNLNKQKRQQMNVNDILTEGINPSSEAKSNTDELSGLFNYNKTARNLSQYTSRRVLPPSTSALVDIYRRSMKLAGRFN